MSKKNGMVFSLEMKKNGGYFLDVLSNTLHITPLFEKKAAVYGTKECEIMDTLLLRNAVKPTIKVHENKRAPRITYLMMEVFISKMPNAEANFREYKSVCLKSKVAKNPYKEVLSWFEKAFPFYHNLKVEVDGKVVWNALDEYRKALESQSGNANNIITLSAATEDKKMLLPPHNPKGHKQMPPGERAKTLFRLFCFKEKKPLKYQRQKNIPSEG